MWAWQILNELRDAFDERWGKVQNIDVFSLARPPAEVSQQYACPTHLLKSLPAMTKLSQACPHLKLPTLKQESHVWPQSRVCR